MIRKLNFIRFIFSLSLFSLAAYTATAEEKNTNTSSSVPGAKRVDSISVSEDFNFFEEEALAEPTNQLADPLEKVNRAIFKFNDRVYDYLLIPFSKGYSTLVPLSVRKSINNFYTNWAFPIRLVNTGLQGKFNQSARETERFLVNTTWGIAGFFDPASDLTDLSAPPSEDLGQSLAHWGVGHGPYLVLPLLGPSSARDLVGRIGDRFLDPINYLNDSTTRVLLNAEAFANDSPSLTEAYQALKDASTDPYVALKNAYSQRRKKQLEE